jgi:hypothetical protein
VEEQPALLNEFSEYFAACDEVSEFFREHRSVDPKPTSEWHAVAWTAARSYRTYLVVVHLCKCGYCLQAAMLNRTLFEDMLAAHWATKHPEAAARRIAEHDQYTALVRAEHYKKHSIKKPSGTLPSYTPRQRAKLDRRYRRGTSGWTGKSTAGMLRAVESMWTEADRRLLTQMHDIVHRASNTLLHHSAISLSQGVSVSEDGNVTFNVGPTDVFIRPALAFALWTFPNTFSLLLEGANLDALNELMRKHLDLYSTTPAEEAG